MKIKYKSKEVREGKRGKEVIGAQEEERSITYDLTRATLKLSLVIELCQSLVGVRCGWIAALSKKMSSRRLLRIRRVSLSSPTCHGIIFSTQHGRDMLPEQYSTHTNITRSRFHGTQLSLFCLAL